MSASIEVLTTYLNDHLAGSVAAVELLDHLAKMSKGTEREKFFTAIRAEVEADQSVLKQLLQALGGKENRVRKAAAWLTEKVGQAKLELDDPGNGELTLLEALETLGLGIQGKLALWRSLEVAVDRVPQLRQLDLAGLQRRGRDQFERVEGQRLRAARAVLGS